MISYETTDIDCVFGGADSIVLSFWSDFRLFVFAWSDIRIFYEVIRMVEKEYEATITINIMANNKTEVKKEITDLIGGKVADFKINNIEVI